jgi:hypothetical protein
MTIYAIVIRTQHPKKVGTTNQTTEGRASPLEEASNMI